MNMTFIENALNGKDFENQKKYNFAGWIFCAPKSTHLGRRVLIELENSQQNHGIQSNV